MSARRYLTVIQDARGYPPPGGERDPAPPEGPAQPVLHSVVLADEFDRVEAEAERLRDELQEAHASLGIAVVVMTAEQQIEWQRQMRAMKAEAAVPAPRDRDRP